MAKVFGVQPSKSSFHATLICQALEMLVIAFLLICGNNLPDLLVVPLLSFAAALQITSFNTLRPWKFTSAMTTGNLKSAVSSTVLWIKGHEPEKNRGQAIVAGTACTCFITGALFGGFYTHRHPRYSLAPCLILLFGAHLLTWRTRVLFSKEHGAFAQPQL